jgi:hypothetical protein
MFLYTNSPFTVNGKKISRSPYRIGVGYDLVTVSNDLREEFIDILRAHQAQHVSRSLKAK